MIFFLSPPFFFLLLLLSFSCSVFLLFSSLLPSFSLSRLSLSRSRSLSRSFFFSPPFFQPFPTHCLMSLLAWWLISPTPLIVLSPISYVMSPKS